MTHPFVAPKAWKLTTKVLQLTDSIQQSETLDHDPNGGQVDAFRHTLWMACLAQHIRPCKVVRLGNAHEKGNRRDFEAHQMEDGSLPDSVSGEMDYRNNAIGITLGKEYKKITVDSLIDIVINHILEGNLWVISKDQQGRYLDFEEKIIPEAAYLGTWNNQKCLVPSGRRLGEK